MPTRRILVADDDKNVRLTLTALLEAEGYEVEAVSGGTPAVFAARRPHPDGPFWAALIDYKMPMMDGVEAIYTIHRDVPETRLVLISAQGTFGVAADAVKYGATAILPKPFTPEQVRMLLHEFEAEDASAPASSNDANKD